MKTIPIEKVKKGDFFKRKENGSVYVADGYDRVNKKYAGHKFNDISSFCLLNKGTLVLTDFIF
jgi:hypothetical protein